MIAAIWNRITDKAEYLFLLFAVPFGLAMVFWVPPLGGGDEGFHLHRIVSVAYLELLNKPVMVPAGVVNFLQSGLDFFHGGLEPPFHYSYMEWQKMAAIPLDSEHMVSMKPTPVTIHHPFSYLPQVVDFAAGAFIGLSPVILLYLTRLTGLAAGIYLTFLAIRLMPSHKYILCAIALLPTITFYRSYVNADSFTDGLAFLFISYVLKEILRRDAISQRTLITIAAMAFILAQCKSVYLFLSFLAIAIPDARFSSSRSRLLSLGVIILPGALASVAFMLIIKLSYYSGVSYHTWGGDTNPEKQVQFILHSPLTYIRILFSTLFLTPFIPDCIAGLINDVGPGFLLPVPVMAGLLFFLIMVIINDKDKEIIYGQTARILAILIFAGVLITTLTILYAQWTGLHGGEIKGFQGRYLYPVLPLLVIFLEPDANQQGRRKAASYIALMAFLGLSASLWQITSNYY